MDLEKGFQKFETQHKGERLSDVPETSFEDSGSKDRAEYIEHVTGSRWLAYSLLVAAMLTYAVWAWWPL